MTRESAYRLRDKPGATSFAAASDAVVEKLHAPRKSTTAPGWNRIFYGTLKPLMRGGKHVGTSILRDTGALLALYRRPQQEKRQDRRTRGRSQAE